MLTELLPGGRIEHHPSAGCACFIKENVYPLAHRHGQHTLQELLEHSPQPAAVFCKDTRLTDLTFRDFVFIDTETTGLRGAGTLAFMVGVAYFNADALVVRQYFLRDHADEGAMLHMLADLVNSRKGVITFNGRSFDLPLLDNRYLMNRLDCALSSLSELPHIDLLHPARRIWRGRLSSCSLASLEKNVLDVQRTHEDVPGWAIPALYTDYLHSGDIRPLLRVFYHNRLDMLSMVTLATRLLRLFVEPCQGDHPLELLGCGRWQAALGMVGTAENTLRLAHARADSDEVVLQILYQLGDLLKRDGRRDAAVAIWEQAATYQHSDVIEMHVELAKHHEWHTTDYAAALQWTQRALDLVEPYNRPTIEELEHRRTRLQAKIAKAS